MNSRFIKPYTGNRGKMMERASGILMHITSLPGKHGIGDLGEEAYHFADFLKDSGQHLWQMLPVGPPGYGNVPYQSSSAFAGNPLLISLDKLMEAGLLERDDLAKVPEFPKNVIDFDRVTRFKMPLLYRACREFQAKAEESKKADFEEFCWKNFSWLDNFALFTAIKTKQGFSSWNTWEQDIRHHKLSAIKDWQKKLDAETQCQQLLQYFFYKQWISLKKYCNDNGIKLIGDIPVFVALDSADVWAHTEMFFLDDAGNPTVIAGVPPDYFSKTGQLWGNPLYRWEFLKNDNYRWWVERIRSACTLFDFIRIDHFRGFEKYWAIPGGDKTAERGQWQPGPGAGLFELLEKELGTLPVIAEDLGVITPEVESLRDRFGFPGMRVLQFAFNGDPKGNYHLPHLHKENCVAYTGTHDNTTSVGWFRCEDIQDTTQNYNERQKEIERALQYLGTDGSQINWDFIRLALTSVADTAIIPMQDVLGLGNEARMNTPGTITGNWLWRLAPGPIPDEIKDRLKELTWLAGR